MCTYNQEHKLVCQRPGRKEKNSLGFQGACDGQPLRACSDLSFQRAMSLYKKKMMGRESNHASEIYFFLRIETVLLVSLTSRLLYEDTVPKQPWMGVRPTIRELLTTDARFCLQLAGNLECRVFPLHVFGSCHVVCVYVGPVGLVAPLIVHYNFFQLKCLIPQKTGEKLPGRVNLKDQGIF
jgi:hypothetical protein